MLTASAAEGETEAAPASPPLDWLYCRLRLAGEGVVAAGGGDMGKQCDSDGDGDDDGDWDEGLGN